MTALHHVQVACPRGGESAVRAFYGDVLRLEEVAKPPQLATRGGVWFRGTGYELHVGVEEPFSPAQKAHPAFLVEDLDESLGILERNLRWTPSSVDEGDGYRRAVMPFSVPRSARLELVQPTGPGRVADAYAQLGPGAWTIRVSVVDVDAKARELAERGTPFVIEDGVLRPDPECTLRVPFEFVTAPTGG